MRTGASYSALKKAVYVRLFPDGRRRADRGCHGIVAAVRDGYQDVCDPGCPRRFYIRARDASGAARRTWGRWAARGWA